MTTNARTARAPTAGPLAAGATPTGRSAPPERWLLTGLSVLARAYLGLLAGLALWAVLPLLLGCHSTVVSSGSMSPRIATGSVLVSSPVDPATLRPGDVVLFTDPADPGRLISHRLVGVEADLRLRTRGDANAQDDSTPVPPSSVRGVGRLLVPSLGQPLLWARSGHQALLAGWVLLTAGAVALVQATPTGRRRRPGGRRRPALPPTSLPPTPLPPAPLPPAPLLGAGSVVLLLAVGVALGPAAVGPAVTGPGVTGPGVTGPGSGPGPVGTGRLPLVVSAAFTGSTRNPGSTFAPDPAAAYGPSNYAAAVTADNPGTFWKLDESSGTTAASSSGTPAATGTYSTTGVNYATAPDATAREAGSAVTLDGTTGCLRGTQTVTNPQVFTVEVWFRTTTLRGGKLIGFGNGTGTTASSNYDRHLYLTDSGQVTFGIYPNAVVTITSPRTYNDGQWHLATASLRAAGMALYLDGAAVGTQLPTNTAAQIYNGTWRVGCDNLSGWPATPTSQYLAGQVDNAALPHPAHRHPRRRPLVRRLSRAAHQCLRSS